MFSRVSSIFSSKQSLKASRQWLGLFLGLSLGWSLPMQVAQAEQGSWMGIFKQIIGRRKEDPPLGSRGLVCLVSPVATRQQQVPVLWRKRPIVVWQHRIGRIEVYDHATQELMTRQLAPLFQNDVVYGGKPLLPGRTYDLKVFATAATPSLGAAASFQVMDEAQRRQVDRQLVGLSPRERVNFWMARGLWEEAIGEVYATQERSPEWMDIQRQLTAKLCGK